MIEEIIDNANELNGGNIDETTPVGYQVFVNDMSWNSVPIRPNIKTTKEELPRDITYDIPLSVVEQAEKSNARGKAKFEDVIESYIYSVLTRKYGYELRHAQIWILF